jgi:glycerol-3-phosphate dehydrogenase (NAD(P)+)
LVLNWSLVLGNWNLGAIAGRRRGENDCINPERGYLRAMSGRIAVIGAGSWGTALAGLLAGKGLDVLIWAREGEVAEGINREHRNPLYLPDIPLPNRLRATGDLGEAARGRGVIACAVPSTHVREVFSALAPHASREAVIVSCTKGIEAGSLKLMSRVIADCLPAVPASRVTCLSGPSFAREVAQGLPTSVVVAGGEPSVRTEVQAIFRTDAFLTFTSGDATGVEVGGAVKNVIAIAAGIADGLGLGQNARAAIITRGLYEMIKIGRALGASPLTFAGLSGIGDLVLTCTAELSRNHSLGMQIARGRALAEIVGGMTMVAEGVPTAEAVRELAAAHRLNVPICEATGRMLFEGLSPRQAVTELCAMPLAEELGALLKSEC